MKRPLLGLCLMFVLYSCSDKSKEPVTPQSSFEVPPEYRFKRTSVIRADLDGDLHADALLLLQDTARLRRCSDTIVLYVWDRNQQLYRSQAVVALDDVDSLSVVSQTDSQVSSIIAHTNSGGNSATASKGIQVMEYRAPSVVTTIAMFDGDPTIERIDSTSVVVHHDVFEPFFSQFGASTKAGAVLFADDVRPMSSRDSSSASRLKNVYFEKVIAREQESLDSLMRRGIQRQSDATTAYASLVRIIRALHSQRRMSEGQAYLRSKSAILRVLPSEFRDAVRDAAHQP